MSDAIVREFSETRNEDGGLDEVHLSVSNADHTLHLVGEGRDGSGVEVTRIGLQNDPVIRRGAFDLIYVALEEIHARGIDVDAGALGKGGSEDTGNETDDEELADGQDQDQDDPDEVWCRRCGNGPFVSPEIHHGQSHTGELQTIGHEPEPEELVGADAPTESEGESDDSDGESDQEPVDEEQFDDAFDTLDGHPFDIIDESDLPLRIDLNEVLEAYQQYKSVPEMANRLNVGTDTLCPVLGGLGLMDAPGSVPLDDGGSDERAERVERVTGHLDTDDGHEVGDELEEEPGTTDSDSESETDAATDGGTVASAPPAVNPGSGGVGASGAAEKGTVPDLPENTKTGIPEHITAEALTEAADEYETIEEVADAVDWEHGPCGTILHRMGLYHWLKRPEARPSKDRRNWGRDR